MHEIHLPDVDLNLLAVLEVLLEEQSVTKAAQRLHRTQSAVSHSLARLRELFDDELLVRDGRRMRPTQRATELANSLPRVLDQVRSTLAPLESFDPATSTRTFRLAAPDFAVPLLPSLLAHLSVHAPRCRVELVGRDGGVLRDVADGRIDGLVAPASLEREDLRAQSLGRHRWRVFARAGHPALADWGQQAWARTPHLLVRSSAPQGDGPVARALRPLGLKRTIGAVVPSFSMAPAVVAQTDLLLTVPAIAVGPAARAFRLVSRPVPFRLEPMSLALFRSASLGNEPGIRWFLDQVATVVASLSEPG